MTSKIFIIAEAGVNHDGKVEQAFKLVDVALEAKADAVKFQTWKPGECTGKFAYKVDYLKTTTAEAESRFELSKRLCLPYEAFEKIQKYCKEKGILFLSTPDGYQSLDFLVDQLKMPMIKVSSTEVTHLEFLRCIGKKNLPTILSSGMSTLEEVRRAASIVRENSKKELTVLHCTSEYPAPYDEVNLRAMVTMHQALGLPVGYSDHTIGDQAAIAAVALGATIIEKHFTMDKTLPGPDHKASLNPDELASFVESIRITERMMGDGVKRPSPSEIKNIPGVRRGIVAAHSLKKGVTLTREMLTFKRPNTGLQPDEIDRVIGRRITKDLEEDEVLKWDFIE